MQQMVRADRADLVLPRRQRVPLQQHTIALQHAATTRRRHACHVPHAARDSLHRSASPPPPPSSKSLGAPSR
jgi:hypothetical protein